MALITSLGAQPGLAVPQECQGTGMQEGRGQSTARIHRVPKCARDAAEVGCATKANQVRSAVEETLLNF